jgi:hypothetical protein
VKRIDPDNLVFLDEMGVLLRLRLTHARSPSGKRLYDLKPFYLAAKVTVIAAISLKKVVGLMALNGSMDGKAFSVFVEKFLYHFLKNVIDMVLDFTFFISITSLKKWY